MKLSNIITVFEASHSIQGKDAYIAYLNTFKSILRELITVLREDTEALKEVETYSPGTLRARRFSQWWSKNSVQFTGAIRAIQEHRNLPIQKTTQKLLDTGRTIYKADAARRNEITANSDRSIDVVFMMPEVLNEMGFHNMENVFSESLNKYNAEYDNAVERFRAAARDRAGSNTTRTKSKGYRMSDEEPIPANARVINHDAQTSASTRVHQSSYATGIVEQTIRRLPIRLQDDARKHVAKANNKLSALRDFLVRNGVNPDSM